MGLLLLSLSLVVPATGEVNSLMVISFVIHNKSEIVQEFEIKMIQDDDTHFLAAGNQMVCVLEHPDVRG